MARSARTSTIDSASTKPHPRVLGWLGTTALAMGGSNQSLFVLSAIVATQGTAAVPLLVIGLLLSWAAAPGWTELILMWPDRVGGIAATCAEAFRPYSPVLANLTGVCYWWGWVPTCGLTAILSASALHEWYLPGVPVSLLASLIVLAFTAVNLCGIRWVTRLAIPVACCSAGLALLSALVPALSGSVDWHRAASFSLHTPFHGVFGAFTSAMAGLYLIGFAAPAFEAAACHVGETKDPAKNVPRAMFASAGMASIYFIVLPVIWLGVIGGHGIGGQLIETLGPAYAPLLGSAAKAAAIWFMVFNMFHGTLQPLAGAARTLSQLSDDGLLPRMLGRRNRNDAPWVATVLTAAVSILFLQSGDPPWVIAAANFTYLIGIGLPSVAVWLLRRNSPEMKRPYRAPRGMIMLGVCAAVVWGVSTIFGFEQFGLPTVLAGLGLAYAGSTLYAWRAWRDRVAAGAKRVGRSLHFKLTGAMLAVMALDGTGYLLAVSYVPKADPALITLLADIFVAVAILTIAVGLVLPGMIAHSSREVAKAATDLAEGTVADLTRAMEALGQGDLDAAYARRGPSQVPIRTRDEVGLMAASFNTIKEGVTRAAKALDGAREGLRRSEAKLERNIAQQAAVAELGQRALEGVDVQALMDDAVAAAKDGLDVDVAVVLAHEPRECCFGLRAHVGVPQKALDEGPPRIQDRALASLLSGRSPVPMLPGRPIARRLGISPADGLLMPVHAAGKAWGVLAVYSIEKREFTREETDFVHALGNVLAEAVQRVKTLEDIRHQALHDPLTALPNRTLFVDHLGLALGQSARRNTLVAVLFLDLDHFKLINDSLGHSAGDEVLRHAARLLDEWLRPGDTVARFGGDEFVMICTDLQSTEEASVIAARLSDALMSPYRIRGIEHRLAASIGIATASGRSCSPEDLIREADAAMYRAKERGRSRFEVFDEHMRQQATHRLWLANELALALEREELRVKYQPIVRLEDGGIEGVEALARWHHPTEGEVSPDDFIVVAEETGAIMEIGEFVLRESCRAAAEWNLLPGVVPVPVSVNVSLRQVRQGDFPDVVASVLVASGLDPSLLHLEITESVLMAETEAAVQCMDALKQLGVSLVLDDFGTGYSSLAYVKRFPIDRIKIDRAFVADLEGDNKDATIVEAIIYMARGLRLEVIAEGVETAAQATWLNALRCKLGQGWHFAPALEADQISDMIRGQVHLATAGSASI